MNARTRDILRLLLGAFASLLTCVPAAAIQLSGNLNIHDPSRILKEDDRYYVFATGSAASPVNMKYSNNLTQWTAGPNGAVFSSIPQWALNEVTVGQDVPTNMWAPDVVRFNGEYRLYYSVSTFGRQNSVIGLATNTTLDFNDPNYQWVDQQMVIESENGFPYNAIDPAIFYDDDTQRMWMTWGSFWNGIYVTELDPDTGKRITPNSPTTNVARRAPGGTTAIEAPYLMKHDAYHYLFVNWDICCDGVNSTYKIRVGRGTSPTGPFVDRAGVPMLSGGGEHFHATEGSVIGPGHFSSFSESGVNYFGYHFYDGTDNGIAKYAIEEYVWTPDGWPVRKADLPSGDYNANGVVDAADYTVWRDTLGSTTDLRANGNDVRGSAGVIDQADYEYWKTQFAILNGGVGAAGSLAAAPAVPEPTSLVITALAAALTLRRRARVRTN